MEFNDVRIAQSSIGEIIGLEDVFLNRNRIGSVRCVSSIGSLYKIKSEEFIHKIKKDSRVFKNFENWINSKDSTNAKRVLSAQKLISDLTSIKSGDIICEPPEIVKP
jgi:hypothetical protein